MIRVEEVDALLRETLASFGSEAVPLRSAQGRILQEDVFADRDYPPFDRVAMDGIAIARAAYLRGVRRFSVQGVQAAGAPARVLRDQESCFEAMTGAVLPQGCDAVIRYEDLRVEANMAQVTVELEVEDKSHVHLRGSDARQGARLLSAGTKLLPPHIAVLASVGKRDVRVSRRPSIAFVSTGDELVPVEVQPEPHQIRQSNGPAIAAALALAGLGEVALEHAHDSEQALAHAMSRALRHDVVLVSGGVSMGKFDLVPRVLQALGVRELFHKIAQKPGKPLWFGVSREGTPVFGLPGNPVSSLVCVHRYVLPQLLRVTGADVPAPTSVQLVDYRRLSKPFTHFVPVHVTDGVARPVASTGSGDFVSLTSSDGFVEVAPSAPLDRVPFHSGSRSDRESAAPCTRRHLCP